MLSGFELVADRIPRGVDSCSIEGVEARVLSPASIRLPIATRISTQTSLEEALGWGKKKARWFVLFVCLGVGW